MAKTFTADEITAALKSGRDFSIPGVGKLKAIGKAAREGRNPATGAAVTIPAQTAVKFSISKTLKQELNPHLAD